MSVKIKAYFNRHESTIEGVFTLQAADKNGKIQMLFHQLPARSGQKGYTHTSWERNKSPIPYGEHRLWLKSVNPGTFPTTPGGIGEFYPISNTSDRRVIANKLDPNERRLDIGLHPENAYAGSAGCIVLLIDTPKRKKEVERLFAYLRGLGQYQEFIELRVL